MRINTETESYLLIPLDLALTGHQPLREAESNYHNCRRCFEAGKEENLDTSQVSLALFRITNKENLFFVVVALLDHGGSNILCAI